jgi:hypothetical protein
MPQWWEERLKLYESHKMRRDAILATEDESLDWKVVTRLTTLEVIQKSIEEKGEDPWRQLVNVKSLIKSYRSGDLIWNDGLVTYWSDGECICDGPMKFDWDDVDRYNDKCEGKSFWVEGVCDSSRSRRR